MKKPETRMKRDYGELKRRVEQHYAQVHKYRERYANKRIMVFVTLLLLNLGLLYLHRTSIYVFPEAFVRGATLVLSILIVFTVSSVIVRLVETRFFSFFENEIEIEKRLFYTKLFTFLVYLFSFLFVLYSLGITLSNITLIAGLITSAFALSMRDVLASYMAWMVLLFKKPFRIGDFIKIGDDEGQVEHIGTFFVTVDDGTENPMRAVKIPTQLFLSRTVISYGTGDVPETIRIRMHSPPTEKQLEKVVAAVKETTGYAGSEVTLDTDLEFTVLIVSYETPFIGRKQVRTKVISKILSIVEDVRKITK